MRYSGSEQGEQGPWFTLGKVDVTTTTLVLLAWAATLLVYIASSTTLFHLAVIPDSVTSGEVWRVVTWPFAHLSFTLGDILAAAIFWLFGTYLEQEIGRRPFAILMGASTVIIAISAVVWSTVLSGNPAIIYDLGLLELTVVLLYIAEHPTRPFFFNIPAWVIAAVIVALEVVNDLADREWSKLLTIIVAAALIALVARKLQLLTMYDRVPDIALPSRRRRGGDHGLSTTDAPNRGGSAAPSSREPRRTNPLWGKKRESAEAEIVPMPTASTRRRPVESSVPDVSADDLALDLLLDKISDGGMDSLSPAERKELDELRSRRRGA